MLSVAPERTVFALNRAHERFFAPILAGVSPQNLVVQPQNRGTAPAILYSLLRLAEVAPRSSVLLMPSDHHVGDESAFMKSVDVAFATVAQSPELAVLLGIEPDAPETAYGWIEPGQLLSAPPSRLYAVRRFWEKPPQKTAVELMVKRCLWNSFVIVGHLSTLVGLFAAATPELYVSFLRVRSSLGTAFEEERIRELYEHLSPGDFSRQVLASPTVNLAVLPVRNVGWSDLGEPQRVSKARASLGIQQKCAAA